MSHDSQTSSGFTPNMLERLDPRVAVHPGYMLAHGDEEVMPTCLVSDWVSFVQHDTQHVDQALHIRRRDLEDSLEVQAQDDDPYAPGRVMPDGYWLIDTSPEEDAPSPIDTSATVILQYKTFRICICHIEQNVVIGTADVDRILSCCLRASSVEELPPCMGSMLYEGQCVHWLVVPALDLYLLSSLTSVEETRTLGNIPEDLDADELKYNLDSRGIRELSRLRRDLEGHVVSSLRAKLTPELREAHKESIERGKRIKLDKGFPELESVENYRQHISESVNRPTPAVDNGQTMLSRQPRSLIGRDPYAEQQNMWANTVCSPPQHRRGWPEGNPQALSIPLGYGVQATGSHPTFPSRHSNCLGPSSLYAAQNDTPTRGVAYPRNAGPATTVPGGDEHSSAEAGPGGYWDYPQGQQSYNGSHNGSEYSGMVEEYP